MTRVFDFTGNYQYLYCPVQSKNNNQAVQLMTIIQTLVCWILISTIILQVTTLYAHPTVLSVVLNSVPEITSRISISKASLRPIICLVSLPRDSRGAEGYATAYRPMAQSIPQPSAFHSKMNTS
jgi:hypothetical protein